MMETNTIAEVTLKYENKYYKFNYSFGCYMPGQTGEEMFIEGNYACDCNRSLFIRRYCDKDFPQMKCSEGMIELIEFKILEEGRE